VPNTMNNPAQIEFTAKEFAKIRESSVPALEPRYFYLSELDSLRFFAFLAVFVDHLCLLSGFRSLAVISHIGAHGVDLFFTLSAYLLTELMIREKNLSRLGRLDVRAFYVRRALRIWPLYYGFLLIAYCTTLVYPVSGIPPRSFAMYAALLGDFPITAPTSLIVVSLWSISLEEQFYLIWPNVMQRLSRRGAAAAGAVFWLCCVVVRLYVLICDRGVFWLIPLTHLDSIACGILISGLRLRALPRLWLAGAILWIVPTLYIYSSNPNALLVTICFALIGAGSGAFLLSSIGASWMRRDTTVYLGRISYGLYVYHGTALVVGSWLLASWVPWVKWPAVALGSFIATLAISAASYRWFETPFLKLKERFQYVRSQPLKETA
jgi:peptidoglycan/LPS O-acetylase OafA/YrhL